MQIVQPKELFSNYKVAIGRDASAVFQITAIKKKTRFNQTFAQAYESTCEKIIHMRRASYEVREMWECNFERFL